MGEVIFSNPISKTSKILSLKKLFLQVRRFALKIIFFSQTPLPLLYAMSMFAHFSLRPHLDLPN